VGDATVVLVRPGSRLSDVVSRGGGSALGRVARPLTRRTITAIGGRNYTISRYDAAARASYTICPSCLGFAARTTLAGDRPTARTIGRRDGIENV